MTVDTSGIASNVLGIAGMGIGLGILAHTASNIARSTDRMYEREEPRHRPRRKYKSRQRAQRRRFDSPSFRFNPQPMSLTKPFKW